MRVFVGLGSNLGDRQAHLRGALAGLPDVVAVSPVYETEPVGGPAQEPFLNAVVELATECAPRDLLRLVHKMEERAGRTRVERFGPRTLDVDILLIGDLTIDEPDLVVPHPRMWQRRFVVAPLADLAPDLVTAPALEASQGTVRRLDPTFSLSRTARGSGR